MQNHVHMVAHHCEGVNSRRKNITQFQNACFQPSFTMFKIVAAVFITSTKPRSPHTAIDQVEKLRLGSIYKLAAWLGHGLTLDMLEFNQTKNALELRSDLSEAIESANKVFGSWLA